MMNWLRLTVTLLASFVMLCGCDSNQQTPSQNDGSVLVVEGTVAIPTALVDADVQVYRYVDTQWELLGETQTGPTGDFSVEGTSLKAGDVLWLKVTRGTLQNPITGEELSMPDGLSLEAIDVFSSRQIMVDGFSTLSTHLAMALHEYGPSLGLGSPTLAGAVTLANIRIGDHLRRPIPPMIPYQSCADATRESIPVQSSRSAISLANIALFQFALALPGDDATVFHVISALARDLDDGQFDGIRLDPRTGETIVLSCGGQELDANWTRSLLVEALLVFLESEKNGCGLMPSDLNGSGGLLENWGEDRGPLYPSGAPVIPLDLGAPVVTFVPPTPDADSLLCDPFSLRVRVEEDKSLESVELVNPLVEAPFLKVFDDGDATEWLLTVDPQEAFSFADTLDFEVSVKDAAGHETVVRRTFTIDTLPPMATQIYPTPGGAFSSVDRPAQFRATDQNGSDVAVTLLANDESHPCTHASLDEWNCNLSDLAPWDIWQVEVVDQCHNRAAFAGVWVVDEVPPVVEMEDRFCFGDSAPNLTFTVSDNHKISLIEVRVQGSDEVVAQWSEKGTYSVNLVDVLGYFAGSVSVTAVDTAGNSTSISGSFKYDFNAPTLELPETLFAGPHPQVITISQDDPSCPFESVVAESSACDTVVEAMDSGGWQLTLTCPDIASTQGNPTVSVTAIDQAGNSDGPQVITLIPDYTPPTLSHVKTTYIDPTTASLEYDPYTLELSLGLDGTEELALGPDSCTLRCLIMQNLGILASDLDPEGSFTPMLRFEITDDSEAPVEVVVRRLRDDVEVSVETFTSPTVEGSELIEFPVLPVLWTPEQLANGELTEDGVPDTIEVVATDVAGNVSTVTLNMDVHFIVPGLYFDPVSPYASGPDHIARALGIMNPDIFGIINVGATLREWNCRNPFPFPVAVTVEESPLEWVWVQLRHFYFDAILIPFFDSTKCPTSTCFDDAELTGSQCSTAPLEEDVILFNVQDNPVGHRFIAQYTEAVCTTDEFSPCVIPPETTMRFQLRGSYPVEDSNSFQPCGQFDFGDLDIEATVCPWGPATPLVCVNPSNVVTTLEEGYFVNSFATTRMPDTALRIENRVGNLEESTQTVDAHWEQLYEHPSSATMWP